MPALHTPRVTIAGSKAHSYCGDDDREGKDGTPVTTDESGHREKSISNGHLTTNDLDHLLDVS